MSSFTVSPSLFAMVENHFQHGAFDADSRRGRSPSHRPRLIGVTQERQKVERLPLNEWDLPWDRVITESRVYRWRFGA